jgi:hypothetical protein
LVLRGQNQKKKNVEKSQKKGTKKAPVFYGTVIINQENITIVNTHSFNDEVFSDSVRLERLPCQFDICIPRAELESREILLACILAGA